jgi:hypothetical protein
MDTDIIAFVNNVLNCIEVIKYDTRDWYDLGLNRWYDPLYLNHLEKNLEYCEIDHPDNIIMAVSFETTSIKHDNVICLKNGFNMQNTALFTTSKYTQMAFIIIPIELNDQIELLKEADPALFSVENKYQCRCKLNIDSYSINYLEILDKTENEFILK